VATVVSSTTIQSVHLNAMDLAASGLLHQLGCKCNLLNVVIPTVCLGERMTMFAQISSNVNSAASALFTKILPALKKKRRSEENITNVTAQNWHEPAYWFERVTSV
jgi:hypothetical protein